MFFDLWYIGLVAHHTCLKTFKSHKKSTMSSSTSHKSEPEISKLTLLDYFDEGRLTDWLSLHGKNIVYGLLVLIALLAIVFQLSNSFLTKAEEDYINAANAFNLFVQTNGSADPTLKEEAYTQLKSLMAAHPELHAAYDGVIAQTFLNRGLVAEAKPYVAATQARTQADALPFYSDFASTSLLISEQHYREALDKSQALQAKMEEAYSAKATESERNFGGELFALNLLRIAILQQQLGDASGELATWSQWKQYAKLEKGSLTTVNVDPQAFRAVIQRLAVGATSIPDYIANREKVLTPVQNVIQK